MTLPSDANSKEERTAIVMDPKYSNLTELLGADAQAKAYFSSLPGYVQESIRERENRVCTADMLHRYAENLLAGDK